MRQAFQNGSLLHAVAALPAFSAATAIDLLGTPSIAVLPPADVQSASHALLLTVLVREGIMILSWNALPADLAPSYVARYRLQVSQQQLNQTGQFVEATLFGQAGSVDSYTLVEGTRALDAVQQWSVWDRPAVVSASSLAVRSSLHGAFVVIRRRCWCWAWLWTPSTSSRSPRTRPRAWSAATLWRATRQTPVWPAASCPTTQRLHCRPVH